MRKALETHSTGWDRMVAGLEDTIAGVWVGLAAPRVITSPALSARTR